MARWYELESVPPTTAWLDLGLKNCQRCSTWRRIYRPEACPEFEVCLPCAFVLVNNSYTNVDRDAHYGEHYVEHYGSDGIVVEGTWKPPRRVRVKYRRAVAV